MTIAPDLIKILRQTEEEIEEVERDSLFFSQDDNTEHSVTAALEEKSYLDDEAAFRTDYAQSYSGKGEWKTKEVSSFLSHYCTNHGWKLALNIAGVVL